MHSPRTPFPTQCLSGKPESCNLHYLCAFLAVHIYRAGKQDWFLILKHIYNVCANECRAYPGWINIYATYFRKSKGVASEQQGILSFLFLRFPLFPLFSEIHLHNTLCLLPIKGSFNEGSPPRPSAGVSCCQDRRPEAMPAIREPLGRRKVCLCSEAVGQARRGGLAWGVCGYGELCEGSDDLCHPPRRGELSWLARGGAGSFLPFPQAPSNHLSLARGFAHFILLAGEQQLIILIKSNCGISNIVVYFIL